MSLKLTSICIVDRTGKVEREGVVASDPEANRDIPQIARATGRSDWARDRSNVDMVVDRAE